MNNITEVAFAVFNATVFLKSVSGIIVFGFLIYSLYFTGDYEVTIFMGIFAFIFLCIFIHITSKIPFVSTLSPILFEWFWHDIPFWKFTTAAWIVVGITVVTNILGVASIWFVYRAIRMEESGYLLESPPARQNNGTDKWLE